MVVVFLGEQKENHSQQRLLYRLFMSAAFIYILCIFKKIVLNSVNGSLFILCVADSVVCSIASAFWCFKIILANVLILNRMCYLINKIFSFFFFFKDEKVIAEVQRMKTKVMVVCRENRKLIQRTVRDVVQRTLTYNEHLLWLFWDTFNSPWRVDELSFDHVPTCILL